MKTETEKDRSGYRHAEIVQSGKRGGVHVATGFCWPEEGKISGSFVISEMVILDSYKDLQSDFAVRVGLRNCSG